jgi:hypothetical protein
MQSNKIITILLILTSLSLLAVMALYVKFDSATKTLTAGNSPAKSCCGSKPACCNNKQ